MKKLFLCLFMLIGCTQSSDIIDMTDYSAAIIDSTLMDMYYNADDYMDKTIIIPGKMVTSQNTNTGKTYHMVANYDELGCCILTLDFETLNGEYPEDETEIIVTGTFQQVTEDGYTYNKLINCTIEYE